MHTIHKKEFSLDDFSHEHLEENALECLSFVEGWLNYYRNKFIETGNKDFWWQLIQLLPSSYNQKRTVTMNYENVVTIIKQRTGHRLDEWKELIKELKELPCIKEIMEITED